MSELTYKRNHEPDQIDVWFDYTGFRYKDKYALELKNGHFVRYATPNADTWHPWDSYSKTAHDSEVLKVRLLRDDELDEYDFKGASRLKRNLRMFGLADSSKLNQR